MEKFKDILADEIIKYATKIGMGGLTKEEAFEYINDELDITIIFTAALRWHQHLMQEING